MSTPAAPPTSNNAAYHLLGRVLDGDWRVVELVEKRTDDTGGCFSVGYRVEDASGRSAFLKALDYSPERSAEPNWPSSCAQ
jgi:hypothetical protein